MARTKIDYGIDLGTTNSAVARVENGKPVIRKSDTLKDTMPSCVNYNRKGSVIVGDPAANTLRSDNLRALRTLVSDTNTFIEFKRTMGSDKKYVSSNTSREYSSEELSAEVLKKLKSLITDEDLRSIVVTVPAKFNINQKNATSIAAKLAGFEHCELLQEPIAASMAFGLAAAGADGIWLVFDFGGGTFDAALLRVAEGIMKVVDTEGDNHLGGKNIDLAIVDEIVIPCLQSKYAIESYLSEPAKQEYLRAALKDFAEVAKIQLSFSQTADILSDPGDFPLDDRGDEIELDFTVTQDDLKPVTRPIFQKAIDICKELLKRNGLTGKDLATLVLVGGPTFSPFLQQMLKEQITNKVDTSVDPMTAVAEGAALYASTIDISDDIVESSRDRSKIQLDVKYESTTVEESELVTIRMQKEKTEGEIPDKVLAEVVRGDKGWSSGKIEINDIGEIFDVQLELGKANGFTIVVYDDKGNVLPSEPDGFTIIQGTKIGSATLSYNIGIAVKSSKKGYPVVHQIDGLGKNQPQPATGVTRGLVTQTTLRPGIEDDIIRIPIYEAEDGANDSRLVNNVHAFDVVITGKDLPKLLPARSEVELTLKVMDSAIAVSAFFPLLEYTHEAEIVSCQEVGLDADWLEQEISRATHRVTLLKNEKSTGSDDSLNRLELDLAELERLLGQGRSDYDRKMQVLNDLRKLNRKIDDTEQAVEWPTAEEELKSAFYRLEDVFGKIEGTVEAIDDQRARTIIAEIKLQIPQVIKEKDVKLAQDLTERIRSLDFSLCDAALGVQMDINLLTELDEEFDLHEWSDRNKARLLLNQGLSMISSGASKQALRPVLRELYSLLPDVNTPDFVGDTTLLTEHHR